MIGHPDWPVGAHGIGAYGSGQSLLTVSSNADSASLCWISWAVYSDSNKHPAWVSESARKRKSLPWWFSEVHQILLSGHVPETTTFCIVEMQNDTGILHPLTDWLPAQFTDTIICNLAASSPNIWWIIEKKHCNYFVQLLKLPPSSQPCAFSHSLSQIKLCLIKL